ncbi:MAG: hypothetical protein ABIQ33_14035 [Caldimonas sp.]
MKSIKRHSVAGAAATIFLAGALLAACDTRPHDHAESLAHGSTGSHLAPARVAAGSTAAPIALSSADNGGEPHEPATEEVADFKAFALNALLVPLLDDDEPPRWADPTSAFDCNDGSVTLEGARLAPREPVPDPPFTLHWHLVDCTPLGTAFDLSGEVDVVVQRLEGGDYVATVQPRRLLVEAGAKSSVLDEAFEARTPHGRVTER